MIIKDFIKKNIFLLLNVIVFVFLIILVFIYNQYSFLYWHDNFYPYITYKIFPNFQSPRIIPLILNCLYNVNLPQIFALNPMDFRSNLFVCFFTSGLYVYVIYLFTSGFFLSTKDNISILKRKETLIIFPLMFTLISLPLFGIKQNINWHEYTFFSGICETTVYLEHTGGYLAFFLFFSAIFNTIIKNKFYNKYQLIFYSIIAFCLGLWSELINLSAFFAILFIILSFILQKEGREKLKNRFLLIILFIFFIGFFIYYFATGFYSFDNIGSIGHYDILNRISDNLKDLPNFNHIFWNQLFVDKKWYWFIILIFFSISIFNFKKNKNNCKFIIILSFSLIIGFLITNYISIFLGNYRIGAEKYLFMRNTFQLMETNLLAFTVFTLGGIIFYSNRNIKRIIVFLSLCFLIFMFFRFFNAYSIQIQDRFYTKKLLYNIEKRILLFSIFGETAQIPYETLTKNNHFFKQDILIKDFRIKNNSEKNRYLQGEYFLYKHYFNKNHKHKLLGMHFRNDYIANIEYLKRINIIGDIPQKKGILNEFRFYNLKKYDDMLLTIEDIEKLEKENPNNDILLKAKAYTYFKTGDNYNAIELYKKYLKNNPFDYDALINIAKLYENKNQFKEAEKIYKTLIDLDKKNIFFIQAYINSLYEQNKYNEALKYSLELLNEQDEVPFIKMNIAIIYKELKDKEKVKFYIENCDNQEKTIFFINHKIQNIEEFYQYKEKFKLSDKIHD